jgi:hypothetical protein
LPGPSLTFGFVLATLMGAGFHLIMGGAAHRLALFIVAGWLGFAVGHIIGVLFSVTLFSIGSLHFFSAAVGASLTLFIAHSLTIDRKKARRSR